MFFFIPVVNSVGIPKWVEHLFQLPLPRIALSSVSPSRVQCTATTPKRGSAKIEANKVAYTGGLVDNLGILMSAGADVATLWNRPVVDTEAVLQGLDACPDMNWAADRGVVLVRLIYNTLSEARSRAAILMCNTWDAVRCTFVPVLSHNMLKSVGTCLPPHCRSSVSQCYTP